MNTIAQLGKVLVEILEGKRLTLRNPHGLGTVLVEGAKSLEGLEIEVRGKEWIIIPDLNDFGLPRDIWQVRWDECVANVFRSRPNGTKEEIFHV